MYVLKMDFPTGVVYFTGKKKRIQDCESPGLTEDIELAKIYEDEEEAKKFCKMLIKKYDMEFYYSSLDEEKSEEDFSDTDLKYEDEAVIQVKDKEDDLFGDDFTVDLGGIFDDSNGK